MAGRDDSAPSGPGGSSEGGFDTSGDSGGGVGSGAIARTLDDGSEGGMTTPEEFADRDDEETRPGYVDLDIDPRDFGGGSGSGSGGVAGGTEEDAGVGDEDPPSYSDPPADYSGADIRNKYILNEQEVQIEDVLENENFLYIDEADVLTPTLLDGLSKFYFVYGLLVDIDVSDEDPKYLFRLYENFADLELEVGTFISTPPEEFSPGDGLFQDMSLFDNDIIIVGRFERRIDSVGTNIYDQEYLMYDKTAKKFDGASSTFGGGLWLSSPSRLLFNYKFNMSELGAQSVLGSCIASIRDSFKIARSKNTEYDFKFCESQKPEISGKQVITTNATNPTTDTSTGGNTTSGGGSGYGGY